MFQKLLEKLGLGLADLKMDYIVIGGQALLIYGEPRLTKDIDVTLGVGPEKFEQLQKWVDLSGWKILVDSPREFVRRTFVLPCLDEESGIRIDFIFSFSLYEKQAMARANRVILGKTQVCFASLEDFIIHKVVAGRPRDLEDIKTVLLKNPNPDFSYIRKWLREFEEALHQPFSKRLDEIQRQL